MAAEEDVKRELTARFNLPEGAVEVRRARRIYLEIGQEKLREVLDFAVKDLKFVMLLTITGLDEGERFGVIYHLAQDKGVILNIKLTVPRDNPKLETIIPVFVNAEIYERELADMFGIKVEGLPEGNRYPLPDNWPAGQYPLRKDWDPASLDADEKGEKSGGNQNG